MLRKNICLIIALSLSACASITTGGEQSLSVDTPKATNASCNLTNDKGTWYVPNTPGSVTVHRSYNALNVTCKKDGFESGTTSVNSSTKAMMFGNILVGGIIGAAVDAGTGSGYDYPSLINVQMREISAKK